MNVYWSQLDVCDVTILKFYWHLMCIIILVTIRPYSFHFTLRETVRFLTKKKAQIISLTAYIGYNHGVSSLPHLLLQIIIPVMYIVWQNGKTTYLNETKYLNREGAWLLNYTSPWIQSIKYNAYFEVVEMFINW